MVRTKTVLLLCFVLGLVSAQRYEFKHSLRPPFFLGRGGSLPFWEFGGSTVILEDYIRLTPVLQSKVGWLWNNVPAEMDAWEIHVDLQIGGGGKVGADGMGLWYVATPKQEGPVMGNQDYFKGIGVIFDSFDNDGQNDNPSILVIANDGTKPYDAAQDGASLVVGRCKNIPWRERRTKVKVTFQNELLKVSLESPYGGNSWQECVTHQMQLEKGYYFGVTAATGYLFDNHDLFSWVTYNLDPWRQPSTNTDHADIQQRLDSLTEQPVVEQPIIQPVQQAVQPVQQQAVYPVQRPVQPVQQPVQQPAQQTIQPVQQAVQPTLTMQPVHQPAQQPVQQAVQAQLVDTQDMWNSLKQMQTQIDAMQQQQTQIVATINQLTAEVRTATANRPASQPHIFADALEKLLAIVSDTKTVMADDAQILRNTLLDIKNLLTTGTGGANRELIAVVNDVSKKVARLQTALETAKREQATIVSDLQNNKEVLVSKIEEGSSFGFWAFFIFFQFCFGVAFFLWRKMRDDASKKFD